MEAKNFQSMTTGLTKLLCDNFKQLRNNGKEEWIVLKGSVALELFNKLYDSLTMDGVPKIEELMDEQKIKYWEIACRHFTNKEKRIEMSKAAYIIDLLTKNSETE